MYGPHLSLALKRLIRNNPYKLQIRSVLIYWTAPRLAITWFALLECSNISLTFELSSHVVLWSYLEFKAECEEIHYTLSDEYQQLNELVFSESAMIRLSECNGTFLSLFGCENFWEQASPSPSSLFSIYKDKVLEPLALVFGRFRILLHFFWGGGKCVYVGDCDTLVLSQYTGSC